MKAVLINPSMGDYYRDSKVKAAITLSPPLNLATLSGALLRRGHACEIVDLEADPEADWEGLLRREKPDLVGVTFRTPLFPLARRIAERTRELLPEVLLVAGGVHASTRAEEVIQRAPFDVAVRGEGDETIAELLEGKPWEEIPGLTWEGGETPARPLVSDLDTLAMPDWSSFDLRKYGQTSLVARVAPVADLESSRGCRARCIYCTKGVFGSQYRVKSPERVLQEIEEARAYGFRGFNFVDDSFTTKIDRSIAICEGLIERKLDMPWTLTNGIRVANVNEEFFRVARASGCYLLAFGFETGSLDVLRRIKKGANLDQARRAVAWARKYDFTILGYFMVGLPGETEESIQQTAEFAASLDLDFAKFSITMPLPGTPLYDQWAPYIRDTERADFSIHRPAPDLFQHPDFSWEDLERHTRRAYRTFYGRPRYLVKRLRRSLRQGELPRELRYSFDLGAHTVMQAFSRR